MTKAAKHSNALQFSSEMSWDLPIKWLGGSSRFSLPLSPRVFCTRPGGRGEPDDSRAGQAEGGDQLPAHQSQVGSEQTEERERRPQGRVHFPLTANTQLKCIGLSRLGTPLLTPEINLENPKWESGASHIC